MTDVRLNERQRAFAQQHHWVLEDFLKYRHLPMDEFYDVVVFRFLRAVQQYDECEDLRRYSFQTIAGNHMRSALGSYFAKQKPQHEGRCYMFRDLDERSWYSSKKNKSIRREMKCWKTKETGCSVTEVWIWGAVLPMFSAMAILLAAVNQHVLKVRNSG